ncbi:MAG: extracellular solute-binding protein, partial [Chloroflexi bacterium]
AHPNITIELVHKDNVEVLREDFQTASLAGTPPEMLWTVNDHAGPFTAADIIQPVDDLFDLSVFVDSALEAVKLEGKTWGVPISNGNHLMLLYNKKLISEAPKDTDELFAKGKELTGDGNYGLVWNQTEPFWLVPWLGGFGGKVFAEDGVTPTLNTPEMIATLKFLHAMKYDAKIIPPESDYDGADTLFKEGKAAMIINGDWSLSGYKEVLGDDLGVARIPKVVATGEWPKPYTSGVYFMLAKDLSGDKLEAAKEFINFVTSKEKQLEMVKKLNRLPALKAALDDPLISSDPILKGSADQMVVGTPMPTVLEMRCNWDAMKPEMQAVLADTKSPEDAAAAMQSAAEACIESLK